VADVPELAPCMAELVLAVPTGVAEELPEETVVPVDVNPLLVLVDPPFPNTATPVSSRRLCGGKGTVRARPAPFAAPLVAVEAVLLALVDGEHDAAVPAASTVPTLCEATVLVPELAWESVVLPEALPLLTEVIPVLAVTLPLAEVMPVLAEVTPLLTDVAPVLAAVTPLPDVDVALTADVLAPLADPPDPWQAANPSDTRIAGATERYRRFVTLIP
jgi:hypothetical protein